MTRADERSTSWLRALTMLEMLGEPAAAGGMGVVELARQLRRDKAQVSRMLRVLADSGYVEREPRSARYRLGPRLFALAAQAVEERLRSEAEELVERESARIGERVEVGIRGGALCVTLASAAPYIELRALGWVGRAVPLASSAAGRALLFDHRDEAVARLLVLGGLEGAGPAAPRSLDDLLVRLHEDRRRGWVLAEQEAGSDLLALAAPVRDAAHRTVAAVAVSGPDTRLRPVLATVADVVVSAAGELSAALGSGDAPPRFVAAGPWVGVPEPRRPSPDHPYPEQPGDGARHE